MYCYQILCRKKLVDVSSFTKGHHQNYCDIRKQHHIIKFKNYLSVLTSIKEKTSQRVSTGMT